MPYSAKICLFISVAGLVLLWLAPVLLIPPLERYLVIAPTQQRADALVLMAGSPRERLPTVVRLYQAGRAPVILMANDGNRGAWSQEHQRNLYEVEWAELEMLKQGIPARAIEKLPFSASGTMHDARHAIDFARSKGLRSLLVVTVDYHTRRTLWSFQRAAGDDSLSSAVYPVTNDKTADFSFRRLYILAVEAMKNVYYWWRYASR
jgi:uncharacterized SAM-binding protein YcdF (DUF218 family)